MLQSFLWHFVFQEKTKLRSGKRGKVRYLLLVVVINNSLSPMLPNYFLKHHARWSVWTAYVTFQLYFTTFNLYIFDLSCVMSIEWSVAAPSDYRKHLRVSLALDWAIHHLRPFIHLQEYFSSTIHPNRHGRRIVTSSWSTSVTAAGQKSI